MLYVMWQKVQFFKGFFLQLFGLNIVFSLIKTGANLFEEVHTCFFNRAYP